MSNEGKTEYNPIENPIIITCTAADVIPIDRLLEFQGNLKKLSEVNRQKLFRSIMQEGFTAPFFVWDDQGEYKILDGHQRLKTLLWMRAKGWDVPLLPVVYIEAEDKTAAKKKLLKITSQYGEFVIDEINEWIGGLDADIAESIRLMDLEIKLNKSEKSEIKYIEKFEIIIEVENEERQRILYEEFIERKLKCKILTS